MSFAGRFDPREYTASAGEKCLALEVHDAAIKYGPKPRARQSDTGAATERAAQDTDEDDILF